MKMKSLKANGEETAFASDYGLHSDNKYYDSVPKNNLFFCNKTDCKSFRRYLSLQRLK